MPYILNMDIYIYILYIYIIYMFKWLLLWITMIAQNVSIPNTLGNELKLLQIPNGLLVLFSLKHAILCSMSTNSSDLQVTGCCLVTFVLCYSIGEIRKCFNYDLRRTSIFPQCEKGSNILATIYVCQLVQALHDFPCSCRITTRELDYVRWGSNNGIWFEFHIHFL